jgi:hypothetical protein
MKAKIPILIAAGLFLAIASKAQYPIGGHVYIQGQIVLPAPPLPVVVGYGYDNAPYGRYEERRDWREDDRRDWREDEYERYCREHREYRGDRRAYYRDQCEYRGKPHFHNKHVVVYGY